MNRRVAAASCSLWLTLACGAEGAAEGRPIVPLAACAPIDCEGVDRGAPFCAGCPGGLCAELPAGVAPREITLLAARSAEELWIATGDGRLLRWDGRVIELRARWPGAQVQSLAPIGDGSCWVVLDGALLRAEQDGSITRFPGEFLGVAGRRPEAVFALAADQVTRFDGDEPLPLPFPAWPHPAAIVSVGPSAAAILDLSAHRSFLLVDEAGLRAVQLPPTEELPGVLERIGGEAADALLLVLGGHSVATRIVRTDGVTFEELGRALAGHRVIGLTEALRWYGSGGAVLLDRGDGPAELPGAEGLTSHEVTAMAPDGTLFVVGADAASGARLLRLGVDGTVTELSTHLGAFHDVVTDGATFYAVGELGMYRREPDGRWSPFGPQRALRQIERLEDGDLLVRPREERELLVVSPSGGVTHQRLRLSWEFRPQRLVARAADRAFYSTTRRIKGYCEDCDGEQWDTVLFSRIDGSWERLAPYKSGPSSQLTWAAAMARLYGPSIQRALGDDATSAFDCAPFTPSDTEALFSCRSSARCVADGRSFEAPELAADALSGRSWATLLALRGDELLRPGAHAFERVQELLPGGAVALAHDGCGRVVLAGPAGLQVGRVALPEGPVRSLCSGR